MNSKEYIESLDLEYQFKRRSTSLPPVMRPIWKLSVLILFLDKCCIKKKSSFQKVQIIFWALKNETNKETLKTVIQQKRANPNFIVRFEPSVNRTINIGVSEGIFYMVNGNRITLSDRGQHILNELLEDGNLLQAEKDYFNTIKKKLTEKLIENLLKESRRV